MVVFKKKMERKWEREKKRKERREKNTRPLQTRQTL